MNLKTKIKIKIKSLLVALAHKKYIGRLIRIGAATWNGPRTRVELNNLDTKANNLDTKTNNLDTKIKAISDGYGSAVRGIEECNTRHELAIRAISDGYGSAVRGIEECNTRHELAIKELTEKLHWLAVDNDNLRARIEFIRTETFFELRKQMRLLPVIDGATTTSIVSRIINEEKVSRPGPKNLNVGCGHITLENYINIDARELPGVDVVSDVASLPFEKNSIDTIFASHLIEHFSDRTLLDVIIPHWVDLLKLGGKLVLIAPDAESMIRAYANGEFTFEELREIIFGGQEYDGDFHFTMLSTKTLTRLLIQCGLHDVNVVASNRKNGACLEFEIHASH